MEMPNQSRDDEPAFETSLRTGVLYEASLCDVWVAATGSSYGCHYANDDMGQYVLVMATDDGHPEGRPWMMDTQSIDRENDEGLAKAISQDGIIQVTAERAIVPISFVETCQQRHYYCKCLPVDADSESLFREVADLHDWRYATEDEAKAAEASDPASVINKVSLFFHHGWQWQTGKRGIAIMHI